LLLYVHKLIFAELFLYPKRLEMSKKFNTYPQLDLAKVSKEVQNSWKNKQILKKV